MVYIHDKLALLFTYSDLFFIFMGFLVFGGNNCLGSVMHLSHRVYSLWRTHGKLPSLQAPLLCYLKSVSPLLSVYVYSNFDFQL